LGADVGETKAIEREVALSRLDNDRVRTYTDRSIAGQDRADDSEDEASCPWDQGHLGLITHLGFDLENKFLQDETFYLLPIFVPISKDHDVSSF